MPVGILVLEFVCIFLSNRCADMLADHDEFANSVHGAMSFSEGREAPTEGVEMAGRRGDGNSSVTGSDAVVCGDDIADVTDRAPRPAEIVVSTLSD